MILASIRNWLEPRYQAAGLPAPALRWVQRDHPMAQTGGPSDALIVEDRELHLLLLLLDLGAAKDPAAMGEQVRADLQAAWALRSACLPGEGPGLPGATSAWRVRLHWVGRADQARAWRASILHARQSGSILDEIPVDATFAEPLEAPEQCLERHGLPGLLLVTRSLFRKDAAAIATWTSADRRVRAALGGLEASLKSPRARELARDLQALAQAPSPAGSALAPSPPGRMRTLTVQDVRGVRDLTLAPWPGGHPVQAWVLAGPNGSGKSSLAEAVSLQAFGASRGLCAYLKDGDVTRARTPLGYVDHYLTPLGGGTPRCSFEGAAAPLRTVLNLTEALEALTLAEGSLAAQGDPGAFLDTPGDELGARMARSFSALATRLSAFVETHRLAAGEARTALARRHGISTSTRLATSFQDKIARGLLAPAFAPMEAKAAAFLACRAQLPGGGEAGLLRGSWSTGQALDETVRLLMGPGQGQPKDLLEALLPAFQAQEARVRGLEDHLAAFRTKIAALPSPPLGLAPQASQWAAWLASTPQPAAPPAPEPPSPALAALLAERAAIAEEGKRARPLRDHLAATLAFLRGHGQAGHGQDCPTCGTHLDREVEPHVAGLLAAQEAQLEAHRLAFANLTSRIRQLEQRPPEPGTRACPVAPETRRQIQEVVVALLGPDAAAEALLRHPDTLDPLLKLLTWAETPPGALLPAPAAPAAAACAQAISQAWREAEATLAEPEAWEEVAKELTRRLTQVVAEHLPATLEALWRELAACLSPAPWLLPAPPRFQPRTHRGANQVSVVLDAPGGERLARHLLNDAQRHTLGLAWTFCQHLVQARFQQAWMLLDDPAQDLDQPAFRALCRFLATLLSLYDAAGLPFTLVLLLNQEDRAMDAARETGQGLILLGWTGDQEDAAVRRIALFGAGTRSPQPEDVFARTAG